MTQAGDDVVVVGGGYAGLTAACRAVQLGLGATVLERGEDELYACNSRYAGGVMHVSYHNPKDPPEVLAQAIREITGGHANESLAGAVAGNAARAVDWLRDAGGSFARAGDIGWRQWIMAPLRPPITRMEWKGRGADVTLRLIEQRLRERGGRLERGVAATELIVEQGRCVGVRATRENRTVEYRGRAVVLADGGFQGNPARVGECFAPAPAKLKQRGAGTGVGDGMRMAQAAGAAVAGTEAFYGHLLSRDAMHNDEVWPYPQIDELAAAGIVVDASGRRFADEGMGGVYMANAVARRANPLDTVAIFDEEIWNTQGKAAAIPPNPRLVGAGGTLLSAPTLEALAKSAGVDPQGLVETVRRYNEALAADTLASLSPARSPARRAPSRIATAPFHAVPLCAGLTYTMGGILIDAHGRALDAAGHPVPGLYAAGSATGGLEGGPRVGYVGGLMKAVVFGLLAAEHIAAGRTAVG